MATLAGTSVIAPQAGLEPMWAFKQAEFRQLLAIGTPAGAGLLLLAVPLAAASWGCFHRRRWGWALGSALIAINAAGDLARMMMGGIVEGLAGAIIAGALLWWLTRARVRAFFT